MLSQGGSGPCDSATFIFPTFSDPTEPLLLHNNHHHHQTLRSTPHQDSDTHPVPDTHTTTTSGSTSTPKQQQPRLELYMSASIENLKSFDPFAEADEGEGGDKQSQNYIHIRIQQRNGRKTLTTVQGLPKKFDQKKILKVIKKKFACNGTIVHDSEMGEVIQLQGDQRKDVQEFLIDKKEGLELDAKTIKVHGF
ncbi:Eukaryotic translation initiation factor eIF-1 [Friedmanniomyces endolithicus]|uniref:Eukaryotic translation initiation factor eIF-1 n=1 Tax=Friedmanniomyces endolithicus TaxID=329885 RepID=A0AAN6J8Q7_9PEZI|nr:Eukaryotic translation initiation factor eIF-1 [Friedmanniomyces endolithicus]KAK0266679.1 Eukaryotic translation initiation factor eIF-1 [Friedmanniomyces endolithicus]KAK0272407.1 Eukaryotic translation initiation factor eIF-1 [Friedmanniomyces endolithicus]KAK0303795.1 Eukaryotic translation initiation factor eIF-1 [Friedmanniomyces endolithicus]KAK0314035.1 Eukaryotic translation initiation factor eIF-1 [Friedmanniomyces endolithicus]